MLDQAIAYFNAHRAIMIWISVLSVVMFFGSIALMPVIVSHAPADYFVHEPKREPGASALFFAILRNVVGVVLMLAGIAMLLLPGQGLLMMLLALMLLDIPGKHKLVQKIAQKAPVWRALNYLRQRANKPPFQHP